MRTLTRYPWLATLKGWNPNQRRGDAENAGHFGSGGGKPKDDPRPNPDLDAAMAAGPTPAKPPVPGADLRPNPALDELFDPKPQDQRGRQAKPAAEKPGAQSAGAGPPVEGQPDPARGKAHADIAAGHMKMAQQAMKAGDKETAQKLLQAAYSHHLAATHHASGRHAEAEKAKQAADGHLAGIGGAAQSAANAPTSGKPHEQTQSAAVDAAKAVHAAASSGGDVKAAHTKAHAALDAHHAEGHRAIDRMAAEKHGEGTPRAKASAEKAKAAFSAKVQAVRAKLDSLAGGKAGTQPPPMPGGKPERNTPRPPVPSRRGRATGHPELKALDDRHRKATAAGKRGNPRALGAKVHAILSGLDRHDQAAVRRRYGIPEGASPERIGRAWLQWHEDNPGPRRKPKAARQPRAAGPREPGFIDGLLGRTTLTGKWKPGRRKAFGQRYPWLVKGFDPSEPRDADGKWTTGGGGGRGEIDNSHETDAVPEIPDDLRYTGDTTFRLYRAANDEDVNTDSTAFAEERESAETYFDNPGYGGENLYRADVEVDPDRVLDMTTHSDPVAALADWLGVGNPGAIGVDEWVPQIADKLLAAGIHWVRVPESNPPDTMTWVHIGGGADDPELRRIRRT
jgi:hypothetical protein